jgi:hypothetical protein
MLHFHLETMRNEQRVDPEDDHFFITGAAIEPDEKTNEDGLIYLEDRPIAFSTEE